MVLIIWVLTLIIFIGGLIFSGYFTVLEIILAGLVFSMVWLFGFLMYQAANFRLG